ncbi:MAG: TetR family transcriptional regulator [Nocardioides sp.]
MSQPVKRSYRSPVRQAQALSTRRAVLEAAGELFGRDGYAATTLAEVAARAGVSVDTVYKTFGSKRNLLGEVLGMAVGGDDQRIAVTERPEARQVQDDPDPRSQVEAFAVGVAERVARMRAVDDVMLSAAHADPEVAALRADIQHRQRRAGLTVFTDAVADHDGLRDGVDREQAAATTWVLASPEVHRLLLDGWGWSQERYAAWLADALARTLLD